MIGFERVPKARRQRGLCHLLCGEQGTTTICGYRICASCVGRLRAIATAAGVAVDEELLAGKLRTVQKRALTRAERKLADDQERREIAAARRRSA